MTMVTKAEFLASKKDILIAKLVTVSVAIF